MFNKLYKKTGLYLILTIMLALFCAIPATAIDTSSIVDPAAGYNATDVLTSTVIDGCFDIYGTDIYYWNDTSGLVKKPLAGGAATTYGTPGNYTGTKWNSFVRVESSSYVWVAFTNSGNTDDRIYKVTLSNSDWDHVATFPCNYDMQIYDSTYYVAGKNSSDWNDPHGIWELDTSGNDNHTEIIEIGGYSACFAIDGSGRFYAGTYPGIGLAGDLYRWAASSPYTRTQLSDLPYGANGIALDASGDVFVNVNHSTSSNCKVLKWNGTTGSGNNYSTVATGDAPGTWGNWFGFMDITGTVDNGGYLYLKDYYFDGLAKIWD